jgi:hypothetical protein
MYAYLPLKSSSVLSAGYGDVNVQVYPTPFETHVVIKADTDCEGCLATIYDLNGRAISTVNLLGEALVQLGNLPNGPYHLVISRANVPVFRTTIFKQAQGKS